MHTTVLTQRGQPGWTVGVCHAIAHRAVRLRTLESAASRISGMLPVLHCTGKVMYYAKTYRTHYDISKEDRRDK